MVYLFFSLIIWSVAYGAPPRMEHRERNRIFRSSVLFHGGLLISHKGTIMAHGKITHWSGTQDMSLYWLSAILDPAQRYVWDLCVKQEQEAYGGLNAHLQDWSNLHLLPLCLANALWLIRAEETRRHTSEERFGFKRLTQHEYMRRYCYTDIVTHFYILYEQHCPKTLAC